MNGNFNDSPQLKEKDGSPIDDVRNVVLTSTPLAARKTILIASVGTSLALYNLSQSDFFKCIGAIVSDHDAFQSFTSEAYDWFSSFKLEYCTNQIGLLMIACLALVLLLTYCKRQKSTALLDDKYITRISKEEYALQAKDYTSQEILKLTKSQAYIDVMAQKGHNEIVWNWQRRVIRSPRALKEELFYLNNVESISHNQ